MPQTTGRHWLPTASAAGIALQPRQRAPPSRCPSTPVARQSTGAWLSFQTPLSRQSGIRQRGGETATYIQWARADRIEQAVLNLLACSHCQPDESVMFNTLSNSRAVKLCDAIQLTPRESRFLSNCPPAHTGGSESPAPQEHDG